MVRVPRGFHYPAGARFPGQFRAAPETRPIRRLPVQLYRPIRAVPLQPSNAQAIIAAGAGGPVLVQSASGSATSGTTVTVTLGSNTTAGNCLVVGVGASQGTTNPTVTGITLGGSADHFASAKSLNNNATSDAEIWADPNCAGGQTSVVITFAAGTGTGQANAVWVMEWSKVVAPSPVDATNGATGSSTASFSSGSTGTLAQASELVIGTVMAGAGTETVTGPAAPWTNLAQISPIPGAGMVASYQVVASTTAQTYSGSLTANSFYTAVIASLKLVASAGGAVAGTASVQLGPSGLGNIWYPAQVTLSTTTGITTGLDTSVANLYLGPVVNATTLLGTVYGGNGVVAAALPNIQPGQFLIAQWTGGQPNDVASMNVTGSMDALG